ncbi:hypothetical protein [Acidovorax sp. SUPP2539]|uniref:hypothetical protein n=1 Tax=Acidovorax sp. SUPP2539 TaxID=2920878 RepID=UPI0023DE3C7C|nr:hypothetical protein [Acidovorax sp. SUPP2539]GKS88324.1 hypothetical protein AVTE2539_03185 [Acidovorax sp. SUPP2539]
MNNEITYPVEISLQTQEIFCNILIKINDHIIGNPDAWSVCGLLEQEIQITIDRLTKNNGVVVLNENIEESFNKININYEALEKFSAIPINNEIFDGEFAFIATTNQRNYLFIWKDYESKKIIGEKINFTRYIEDLEKVKKKISDQLLSLEE